MARASRGVEGARTRARLIDAGRRLFAARGYNPTTIADVAAEAGAHPGSLYHAFPAKQDLLIAVLEDEHARFDNRIVEAALEGIEDPVERVFGLLAIYRRALIESDCAYSSPVGSLALELREPDAGVRGLLWKNFRIWIDHVHECLVEAGSRLPDGTDRQQLATLVLATMEGAVMLARTDRNVAPFDAAVTQLREYFSLLESLAGRQTYGRAWRG